MEPHIGPMNYKEFIKHEKLKRVGKVKNKTDYYRLHTCIVDKMPKLTGRAKKRALYNKRMSGKVGNTQNQCIKREQ